MALPVKHYYSTQSAAALPLSGTAGALIAVLDACLVTGFGNVGINGIAVAANVATITTVTNHNLAIGDNIVISGANEAVFNDEFFVKAVPSSTLLTVDCVTALAAATGAMTLKIAPLAWEKAYAATNKAVYRSRDVTGTRLYMRVDDSTTTYATVRLCEIMTSVDDGVWGASSVVYWIKSDVASSSPRPWSLIGDSWRFYFMPAHHGSFPGVPMLAPFGDLISCKPGDGWGCLLGGHSFASATNSYQAATTTLNNSGSTLGCFLARSHTQIGSATVPYMLRAAVSTTSFGFGGHTAFPNPADNGVHLTPVYVFEGSNVNWVYRGILPGVYAPMENVGGAFPARDKTVQHNGKRYIAYPIAVPNNTATGTIWFALDDAWA